jgi:hypothetical protein
MTNRQINEACHALHLLIAPTLSDLICRAPAWDNRRAEPYNGLEQAHYAIPGWLAALRVLGQRTNAGLRPQGRCGFTSQNS